MFLCVTLWPCEARYWAMRYASASPIGFTDLRFRLFEIQGVCSHVKRFANASDVGMQKESSLWHCSALAMTERVARPLMSRSCVMDIVMLSRSRRKKTTRGIWNYMCEEGSVTWLDYIEWSDYCGRVCLMGKDSESSGRYHYWQRTHWDIGETKWKLRDCFAQA